jgi:hypothetical protein
MLVIAATTHIGSNDSAPDVGEFWWQATGERVLAGIGTGVK